MAEFIEALRPAADVSREEVMTAMSVVPCASGPAPSYIVGVGGSSLEGHVPKAHGMFVRETNVTPFGFSLSVSLGNDAQAFGALSAPQQHQQFVAIGGFVFQGVGSGQRRVPLSARRSQFST